MARHWKRIICKSKCAKHGMLAHILEDWIWINWTLGREAGIVDLHVHKFAHETVLLARAFWKIRSGKIARRCGAKHICKSKRGKIQGRARILEDWIWINGAPLWREAHLSKCQKNWGYGPLFDLPMSVR